MSRPKGTPKTGGRKAGTPNKVTQDAREWLTQLVEGNREQIERDLQSLDPKDRLQVLENSCNTRSRNFRPSKQPYMTTGRFTIIAN